MSRTKASGLLIIGGTLVGLLVIMAVFAPLLTAHDPTAISGQALESPSADHWMGTDIPGRDIFAQLVYGTRASLAVALLGASLAITGAISIGVLPALIGGRADAAAARVVVFLLALPGLPLLILIGSLAGGSNVALILMIGLIGAAPNARILRGQTLTLRQRGYITVARGFGGGPIYVLRRHVVPGLGPLIVVGFVNWAGISIALEAGLSFLGIGDPTAVSWGRTLNRALEQQSIYFSDMWTWWVLPAGLAITLAVLGFTFIGVGLEPTFNPRWARTWLRAT